MSVAAGVCECAWGKCVSVSVCVWLAGYLLNTLLLRTRYEKPVEGLAVAGTGDPSHERPSPAPRRRVPRGSSDALWGHPRPGAQGASREEPSRFPRPPSGAPACSGNRVQRAAGGGVGRVRRGRRPGQGPRSSVPPSAPQLCVHDNYRNNPFHNFRHCFCVTQMMYSMIWLCGLQVGPRGPPRGAGELPPGTAPRRPPCPPEGGRCGGFVLPVWPLTTPTPPPPRRSSRRWTSWS